MQTAISQRRVLAGPTRPAMRLTLDGADITDLLSADGVACKYDIAAGTSELDLDLHADLTGYENSRVRFSIGYGDPDTGDDLVSYFEGRLYSPGVAFGPFRLLAEQSLPRDTDYRGFAIDDALYDLYRTGGFSSDDYEVKRGRRFNLDGDTAIMKKNVKLLEAINQFTELAGRVVTDLPSGKSLVMPKPRPGATGSGEIVYTMESIPFSEGELAFKVEPGVFSRNLYSAVRVFRDPNDEGDPGVDVQVPVETETRRKPPKNRFFEIDSFSGDSQAAWDTAAEYAELLRTGTRACSLEGIPANADIEPYSGVRCEIIESRLPLAGGKPQRYECEYSYLVDSEISVEASGEGHDMSASGEGILVSERLLPKQYAFRTFSRPGTRFGGTQLPKKLAFKPDKSYSHRILGG